MKFVFRITLCVALLALVGIPLSAQIIPEGTDLWRTFGDGSTYADFAVEPLPAGFFCAGSAVFDGRIAFQGVPVVTQPAGVLNLTDTIVHRLDDAVFDEHGVAVTRIQMASMEFEGVELLRNECGTFLVGVVLDGEQPVTEMKIIRDDPNGGRYIAPIHVNVKITFTPVDHGGDTLAVQRQLELSAAANATWRTRPDPGFTEFDRPLAVDTDSDGVADRIIPGTSTNFFAGARGRQARNGVLHRGAAQVGAGPEVAGSLGVPNGLDLPQPEVSNVAGAASLCHYDDGCGHCPNGTTYEIAAE